MAEISNKNNENAVISTAPKKNESIKLPKTPITPVKKFSKKSDETVRILRNMPGVTKDNINKMINDFIIPTKLQEILSLTFNFSPAIVDDPTKAYVRVELRDIGSVSFLKDLSLNKEAKKSKFDAKLFNSLLLGMTEEREEGKDEDKYTLYYGMKISGETISCKLLAVTETNDKGAATTMGLKMKTVFESPDKTKISIDLISPDLQKPWETFMAQLGVKDNMKQGTPFMLAVKFERESIKINGVELKAEIYF